MNPPTASHFKKKMLNTHQAMDSQFFAERNEYKVGKLRIETLASGLSFTESPRWHNDRLWFSDFYTDAIYSVDNLGNMRVELQLGDQPGGMGWTPNGDLWVVSQTRKKILGFNGTDVFDVADLSSLAKSNCNDMVVTDDGGAYIGDFGFDVYATEVQPESASLIYVSPKGEASVVAQEMLFPNGCVILDGQNEEEGKTLVVAESMGHCLTAFNIANDGALSNRRVWASLGRAAQADYTMNDFNPEGIMPDGIAVDVTGGMWVATMGNELLKVLEGGEVAQRIEFDQFVVACAMGLDDSLYVCTTAHLNPEECRKYRSARIERVLF